MSDIAAVGVAPGRARSGFELATTKNLELRKRRGLMTVIILLTLGLPVLVLGIRMIFHAVDPSSYSPAGSPGVFQGLANAMGGFGFIAAATLGAAAGTTDLSDGVFRHLVVTGRSRLALYLARIPAGMAIVVPLIGVAFAAVCLVTSFAGSPQPTSVQTNGVSVPLHLDETQLKAWLLAHPGKAIAVVAAGGPIIRVQGGGISTLPGGANVQHLIADHMGDIYAAYQAVALVDLNPPVNQMVKIGLWLELEVTVGFMVGLGLGSLVGQRTLATILMIVLEIVITPILANVNIPHFVNAQRALIGVAMSQLRPSGLLSVQGGGGPGHNVFGGRGTLGIGPMPNWAMITVIVGWIVGWSIIGAWRMMTRDA